MKNELVFLSFSKVFFFRVIRPNFVFSEKVFFTTKSLFSPYYAKKKSIFLTKTLFLSVLGPPFTKILTFLKTAILPKKVTFLQKCVKRPKKAPFTKIIFRKSHFFGYCLEKKVIFLGELLSILLEIPQKVNFQDQPRNLLFYKACGKR